MATCLREVGLYFDVTIVLIFDKSGYIFPFGPFFFLQKCVSEDPVNIPCEYMQAVSSVAVGKFYEGVKIATKVNNLRLTST